uniref:Uncharacterized protein n=1 Tax=Suricata suricatta TaxID=37032 RepID=A0A673TE67_SURSU
MSGEGLVVEHVGFKVLMDFLKAGDAGLGVTQDQVWFKNHRAKLKKAQCKHMQQKQEQEPLAGVDLKTSSSRRDTQAPLGSSGGAHATSLVYTNHPVESAWDFLPLLPLRMSASLLPLSQNK